MTNATFGQIPASAAGWAGWGQAKRGLLALLLALVVLPSSAGAQSIDQAYQKEFAYLQAQKSALQKRAASLERDNAAFRNEKQGEIASLQNRLVAQQMRADALQEQLAEIERDALRGEEHADSLLAVFEQANASLGRYDVELPRPEQVAKPKEIEALFAAAMPVLEASGEVRTESGTYFRPNGAKAQSEITYIGRIAAFAGDVPLAPAGDGRLKVWGDGTARGVFLFESVDKAVEQEASKSWLDTIEAGGLIAWVIVVLGLVALLLVLWRIVALFVARSPRVLVDEVCALVRRGRVTEARRLAGDASGAASRVIGRTLEVLDEEREVADDAIGQAVLEELPAIDRFGTAIMVFAAVAPLLGLLGTVTGMIATFDIITEYGTGDPKMLSSGISEALITTQLGLMVAIPALLAGNLLNARAASLADGLEQAALRILNAAHTESTPAPSIEEEEPMAVDRGLLEAV